MFTFNKLKRLLGENKYRQYVSASKYIRNKSVFAYTKNDRIRVKQEEDKAIRLFGEYPENSGILLAFDSIDANEWKQS